jgi:hypothetical protein
MPYSKRFETYKKWLAAHQRDTAYHRRIVRLHELHPGATLSQLSGHAQMYEQIQIGGQRIYLDPNAKNPEKVGHLTEAKHGKR